MFRRLRARLQALLYRGRKESELDEEIRFHLSEEADRQQADGLSHRAVTFGHGALRRARGLGGAKTRRDRPATSTRRQPKTNSRGRRLRGRRRGARRHGARSSSRRGRKTDTRLRCTTAWARTTFGLISSRSWLSLRCDGRGRHPRAARRRDCSRRRTP